MQNERTSIAIIRVSVNGESPEVMKVKLLNTAGKCPATRIVCYSITIEDTINEIITEGITIII